MAYGLYGSRDYLARCGEDEREHLGYDDSLDHLPQQRWLKQLAGDRVLALRANDIGTPPLTAVRAGLGWPCCPASCAPARNPIWSWRPDTIAAADPRAVARVPPRYRSRAREFAQ